jgi:hypothetical protein
VEMVVVFVVGSGGLVHKGTGSRVRERMVLM